MRPEDITFMDVKSDSVIIQWTVPYISYSPETYVVQYGTSRDSLIHNSSSTDSEEEVMTYSVELSGLRGNTTYYVQVLATNTAHRSNRSTVHTFTTLPLEPGMQSILGDLKGEAKFSYLSFLRQEEGTLINVFEITWIYTNVLKLRM